MFIFTIYKYNTYNIYLIMIKINRLFKINKSMIMYKRKRINTNKYDWTLRTATLFLSLSLMSCALNEVSEKPSVCLWWCFLCFCIKPSGCYCSAVSASTSKILLEVKFMNLFHFLQSETLDLVQQHKNTRWLFYWTFGRCWTDWFWVQLWLNKPRLVTENQTDPGRDSV